MHRLAAPLGRVQTALPNCYGRDHQRLHATACMLQRKREERRKPDSPYDVVYGKFTYTRVTERRLNNSNSA